MKRIAGFLLLCELIVSTVASAEVREVIVTFKTHFDIGYTDLAGNVVQRYRTTMIDQALKVVDQNRDLPPEQQFVWTIPGWPMSKILADWEGQTPQRKQQILQAFKDGRFVVHGLPFTTHTELLEPEDLVRGLGFASRLSREAGLALPRDAKMTDVPYERVLAQPDKMRVGQSPMSVVATMQSDPSAALSHGVTTSAILYAGQPYLDLEVTVHDKPADNWPEAGWVCLPVNARKPQFRLGRLGGIADPARDFVRGSNHDLQAVNTGLTIAEANGRGVGICPLDSPLVSLDRPGLFRYSPDFVPSKPVVFINLFNNQWTTNFRLWNEGTWTTRIRLWPFDRYEAQSALVTPSLEARYPLLAAATDGNARGEGAPRGMGFQPMNHRRDADATRGQDARDTKAGTLSATQKGLELSARGTLVTAFDANPDGPGTVLRLWEYAGAQGPCEVRLPTGLDVKEVQPVNLRGEPTGRPLPVQKNTFAVNMTAFAPVSFIIPTTLQGRP